MTKKEYTARFGRAPERDDLERANCEHAGEFSHWFCGVCQQCGKPRAMCGHFYIKDPSPTEITGYGLNEKGESQT